MLIYVAGMHRSGTSAVTRVLNLLGASLGDESDLMAPQTDNPRGFWESKKVSRFNERILNSLGGTWDDPPPVGKPAWQSHVELASWTTQIRDLILELTADGAETHAIKDPRLSLTLPIWLQATPAAARVLMPIRDPLAVAQSLQRRNSIPLDVGADLWMTYMTAIERCGLAVDVLDYDLLLNQTDLVLEVMAKQFNLGFPSPEAREAVNRFLEPSLNHAATPEATLPESLVRARVHYESMRKDGAAISSLEVEGRTRPTPLARRLRDRVAVLYVGGNAGDAAAIQEALRDNRSNLVDSGLLYPMVPGDLHHWKLILPAIDADRPTRLDNVIPERFRGDRSAWNAHWHSQFAAELIRSSARYVIFSSHLFGAELVTQREVERLRSLLLPFFGEFRVVFGHQEGSQRVRDTWAAVFGPSSVAPRPVTTPVRAARISEFILVSRLPVSEELRQKLSSGSD